MYLTEKAPQPISSLYKDEEELPSGAGAGDNMMMEVVVSSPNPPALIHPQQMVLGDSSEGDEGGGGPKPPKKRAETWVQDETRSLIALRRETDCLFNMSKSNKHLWEQISFKMRAKGFDRSPTMCTDKWRNLLKEFKKAKHHHHHHDRSTSNPGGGPAKMSYYKEIDEILKERTKGGPQCRSPPTPLVVSKVDSFMQFADKGFEEAGISFGPVEATDRSTLNLERRLNNAGDPLSITAADAVAVSGVPPWNWRETPGNGAESQSYGGRVIMVKYGDYTLRIGIDGTPDAIKEAIRCAFRLRTKRAFWLEDEDQIIRCLDRDMPLGNYTLHLDEGLAIKVCLYDESDHMPVHTEDKIFYNEDEYHDFLNRHGWTCLRELDAYRNVHNMDDLRPGAIYRGVS